MFKHLSCRSILVVHLIKITFLVETLTKIIMSKDRHRRNKERNERIQANKNFLDNANPLYFIPVPTILCYFCLTNKGITVLVLLLNHIQPLEVWGAGERTAPTRDQHQKCCDVKATGVQLPFLMDSRVQKVGRTGGFPFLQDQEVSP